MPDLPALDTEAERSRYAGRTPLGPDDLEWQEMDGERIPLRLTKRAAKIVDREAGKWEERLQRAIEEAVNGTQING